jgi:hypothetical protein
MDGSLPERKARRVGGAGRPLSGPWLVAAWAIWVGAALLAAGILVAAVPVWDRELRTLCTLPTCAAFQLGPTASARLALLGISRGAYAATVIALELLSAAIWLAVAVAIAWRRPADHLALFSTLTLILFGAARLQDGPLALAAVSPAWWWLVHLTRFAGSACLSVFLYIFPDGRFVPRWTRWIVVPWILVQLPEFFLPSTPFDPTRWPAGLQLAGFAGFVLTVAVAQAHRYWRVSSVAQREQTRWVMFGIALGLVGYLVVTFALPFALPSEYPAFGGQTPLGAIFLNMAVVLALLVIPLSLGLAIARYRLYDVDVAINRALVYGTLTLLLVSVYFGVVVLVQQAVTLLTGQRTASPLAVVISTLAIAALFQPLRTLLQRGIDRQFYRHKYDAARTLDSFGATIRDEVDLDQLSVRLVSVVQETVQPASAWLWLRPAPPRPAAPDPRRMESARVENAVRLG